MNVEIGVENGVYCKVPTDFCPIQYTPFTPLHKRFIGQSCSLSLVNIFSKSAGLPQIDVSFLGTDRSRMERNMADTEDARAPNVLVLWKLPHK